MTLTNPALAAASGRGDSASEDRTRNTGGRARTVRSLTPC